MTRTVFVDTAYLVALLDRRDANHAQALQLTQRLDTERTRLLTTDAVLLELANYFCRSPLRRETIEWIQAIRDHAGWEIVPLDRPLLSRAESRYRRYHDKTWSLTDCLSMEVLRQRRLTDVATTDRGFHQAGFRALMR